MPRPLVVAACVLAAGLLGSAALVAGPLTPPAGAVTSTYKTLQQVEPRIDIATLPPSGPSRYVISQPGSYYLSQNITLAAGQIAINVFASNVTIDLNGFTIDGAGVSEDAITAPFSSFQNITIRNGTIRNTLKEGIDAFGCPRVTVENVTIDTCINGFGLITGPSASVSRVTVRNAGAGIIVGEHSRVTDCIAEGSASNGFELGAYAVASGCVARGSTGASGRGFLTGEGVTLDNCTAASNSAEGFRLGTSATLRASTAARNTTVGIITTGNAHVERCTVLGGTTGVRLAGGGNRLVDSKVGNAVNGIISEGLDSVLRNTLNSSAPQVGDGITTTGGDSIIDGNHIIYFSRGVVPAGFTTVTRNFFNFTPTPITATGTMIAPIATSAAATTNPLTNTIQ